MSKARLPYKSAHDRLKEAASSVSLPGAAIVIPPAPVAEPTSVWQIVVAGTIDPRQHAVEWYQTIGCLSSAEEFARAKQSLVAVIVPENAAAGPQPTVVQFDTGVFAIVANFDRWIIQTSSEDNCKRMLDVASQVFKKLYELPIRAYGINKTFALRLHKLSATQFLADQLASTDLGLPSGKASAQLTHTRRGDESDTMIQLSQSPLGEKWLSVLYNEHHPIRPLQGGYFDLGPLLVAHAEADWKSADNYRTELSECIARAEEKHGDKL